MSGEIRGLRSHTPRLRVAAKRAADTGLALHICIVNDPASGYFDSQIRRICVALAVQAQRDVAPEYGITPPVIQFLAAGDALPSDDGRVVATIGVVAHIPLDPTAAGWHQPLGVGALSGMLDGYVSTEGLDIDGLGEVLAHEASIETPADPMCDLTITDSSGTTWPMEPGDCAQAGGDNPNAERVPFDLGDGQPPVMLANFALANYWRLDTPADAVVDFLSRANGLTGDARHVPGPRTIGPHGYSAITKDGVTTDVFGANGERVQLPAHKSHPESRIMVRQAKMRESTRSDLFSYAHKLHACARAAHEANRAYCIAIGDHSQAAWEHAPEWQSASALSGVTGVLRGNGPEQSHESWLSQKAADGWKYGPTKDPEKKEHPCFVPYASLPPAQKAKDAVFVSVVRAMAYALGLRVSRDTDPAPAS